MDRLELPKSKYQIHRQIEIKNLSAFFITPKGEIKFIIGASNYEKVGIYVTENNSDFSVNPSVEKFFDYKAFGEYIGDAYYGKFVCDGFIYNDTDTSLLDILYQGEPMTMEGM